MNPPKYARHSASDAGDAGYETLTYASVCAAVDYWLCIARIMRSRNYTRQPWQGYLTIKSSEFAFNMQNVSKGERIRFRRE